MDALTTYASLKDRVVFISGGGSRIVAFCDIDTAASFALFYFAFKMILIMAELVFKQF